MPDGGQAREVEKGKNSKRLPCGARARDSIGERSCGGGEKLYFRHGVDRDGPEKLEDAKKREIDVAYIRYFVYIISRTQ
jgi:hypothetical protein